MKKFLTFFAITIALLSISTSAREKTEAETTSTVYFEPGGVFINQIGKSVEVTVTIDGGGDLAGYDFVIMYNPQVIEVEAVELLAESLGMPLGPVVENEKGRIAAGVLNHEGQSITEGVIDPIAKMTIKAVAEGSTQLSFEKVILVDTNLDAFESNTSEGHVLVAEEPQETPVALRRDWNKIRVPEGDKYTASEALLDIKSDCSLQTAPAISRLRRGWWESFVPSYGGVDFVLKKESKVYVRVEKDCTWMF